MTERLLQIVTESPGETTGLGAVIAEWLQTGDVLLLNGDLGAGKTTLVKGVAAALGIEATVSSPSFALVNEYDTGQWHAVDRLYHLDLYRLSDEHDLVSIGFADFMSPTDGVAIVEWPELAARQLPERYLLIEIERIGEDRRRLLFSPYPADDSWADRVADLRARLSASIG